MVIAKFDKMTFNDFMYTTKSFKKLPKEVKVWDERDSDWDGTDKWICNHEIGTASNLHLKDNCLMADIEINISVDDPIYTVNCLGKIGSGKVYDAVPISVSLVLKEDSCYEM